MTLEEIERRLSELRSEQLRTKDKRQKLIITGEIHNLNERKARLLGKRSVI